MSLYNIIQSSRSLPIDNQMDIIYDYINQAIEMENDGLEILNSELNDLITDINDISLDCLLGIACATLPVENELISRPYFMAKCKEKYPDPGLWHGL